MTTPLLKAVSQFMPGWKTASCNLDEFGHFDENKFYELVSWLQKQGYLTMKTIDQAQFNKLKSKEKKIYSKISPIGLYCAYCTVHRSNEISEVKPKSKSTKTLTLNLVNIASKRVREKIKHGKSKGKYQVTLKEFREVVKTIIVPLDPEWDDLEVLGGVDGVVARFRHDPLIPSFTTYDYTIE